MTALTSISDLVNRATGGNSGSPENYFIYKMFTIANVSDSWAIGFMYSAWKYDGYPAGGSNPGAVAVPTNATNGAMAIANPGGGRQKWLTGAAMVSNNPGAQPIIFVYDRLLHIGGLSGTVTTAQNVQSGSGVSLTRNTGGVGNQIWVEIYTAVGTTIRTITASYTNSSGTSGRTTTAQTFGGTAGTIGNDANLIIPLPLQAGDVGVQSVETVTIGAGSTGTVGDFGVNIVKPVAIFPQGSGGAYRNFVNGMPGLPAIPTDACLALAFLANSTTEAQMFGCLSFVES